MSEILLRAKLTKASRKKDGTVSLAATTVSEITPEQLAELDKAIEVAGYLMLSPNPADPANVPEIPVEDFSKTPSERMRSVLFVWWQNHPKKEQGVSFEQFYKDFYEVIINYVKKRLPEASF